MKSYKIKANGILGDSFEIKGEYKGILLGPELEFFTLDAITLQPRDIHHVLRESQHYGTYIKPELPAEQVEITCDPSLSISLLEEKLVDLYQITSQIARDNNTLLVPVAYLANADFTITDDKRYYAILDTLGEPGRRHTVEVASDQINIGATNERMAFKIYNRLRNFIPVFTGLAVASPFIGEQHNGKLCNRMDAYNNVFSDKEEFSTLTGFPPEIKNLKEYVTIIESLPILQHPNAYYKYMRPMPNRGVAAEIRSLDKQPTLKEYLGFVALAKGIVLNEQFSINNSPEEEFERALVEGIYNNVMFNDVLNAAESGLPSTEIHYLNPLKQRIMTNTSVSEKMLMKFYDGLTTGEIYRYLSENYLGDPYV